MYSPVTGIKERSDFLSWLTEQDFPTVKTNKKIVYLNIPAAFDIETSSFYNHGDKQSVTYAWGFGIYNQVTVGRTWEEFQELLTQVFKILHLSDSRKLVIYVHNLPYEFQFMRKLFEWEKVFLIEERKPVYCNIEGIEFKCSYKLSGKSLAKVGEDLSKYPVSKLVGDLDYSKLRLTNTPLTETEWHYIENDIRILLHYIQETIEQDGDITRIPLTKTGYVRNYCRKSCFKHFKRYKALMAELTLDPEEYLQLKRAFAGGFTHANAFYARHVVEKVGSFDFTSSYPYVLLSEKFPMSKARLIENLESYEQFDHLLHTYACLFDIRLTNLRPKTQIDHPLSYSKCWNVEHEDEMWIDNGRVVKAKSLWTTITEQDYFVLEAFYDWDDYEVANLRVYKKDYLPKALALAVLKFYVDKTQLKGIDGQEVLYMLSKNMLNACYGMMVTDIVREEIAYIDDQYQVTKPDLQSAISKYNSNFKRFLFYPWGVWVTSYARANLFSGILEFGKDYVYSDTDSIKAINVENHMHYINAYNEEVQEKLANSAAYWNINPSMFSPVNQAGKPKPIGVWDFEGTYKRFKTLGAKRYLVQTDKGYQLTVAGVGKKQAMKYMESIADDPFDIFDDNLVIPAKHTGKNILTYIEDTMQGVTTDYLGNTQEYYEASGIHMEAADYHLSLMAAFIDYIKGVRQDE